MFETVSFCSYHILLLSGTSSKIYSKNIILQVSIGAHDVNLFSNGFKDSSTVRGTPENTGSDANIPSSLQKEISQCFLLSCCSLEWFPFLFSTRSEPSFTRTWSVMWITRPMFQDVSNNMSFVWACHMSHVCLCQRSLSYIYPQESIIVRILSKCGFSKRDKKKIIIG